MAMRAESVESAHCTRHWFEQAVGVCRDCGSGSCSDCLVDVPRMGQFCVGCALRRSGVRTGRRRR
jgi:hypothetical protein